MKQEQIVKLCGGLALLVIVGVFLGGVFILYLQYKYTYIYSSTTGEIIETSVNTDQIQTAKVRQITLTPHIVYKYILDGKVYMGRRVNIYKSFSYSSISDSFAVKSEDEFQYLYPVGSKVSVHYDPRNPSDAVIKPGFDVVGISVTTLGLLLMITVVFIIQKKKTT